MITLTRAVLLVVALSLSIAHAQEGVSIDQIMRDLPTNMGKGMREPNHPSGKSVTSFRSGDGKTVLQLYGPENDIEIIGAMIENGGLLDIATFSIGPAIIKNILPDSLHAIEWLQAALSSGDSKKAGRFSKDFGSWNVNVTCYPGMGTFVTVAKQGAELKHH
jgi:hypothetical protein